MRLIRRHPLIAERDCEHCQAFQYDENTGLPIEVVKGSGEYRPRYGPLPCRTTGCPKGTPEASKSLSERNRKAYLHYRMCRAVGRFPADPIVERNAMIIRTIEDAIEREDRANFERTLIQLVVKS